MTPEERRRLERRDLLSVVIGGVVGISIAVALIYLGWLPWL